MSSSLHTTNRGNVLEENVFTFFKTELECDRFFARASCCKLRRRPRYFSRDRESEIEFDISIEIYLPDETEFSVVVIIECKNYAHPVPVDDAEEFFSKVQQVAAARAKGVIASSASFQSGTRTYSRSKGIGLLRYFDRDHCKWDLLRSPATGGGLDRSEDRSRLNAGLSVLEYQSDVFDFFLQSPARETHSIWGFFEDLLLDSGLSPSMIRSLLNPAAKIAALVPFLEEDELEAAAIEALGSIKYVDGEVALDRICAVEERRRGLTVVLDAECPTELLSRNVLGRIRFAPAKIEVFRDVSGNRHRARFTLAHELAHLLLDHGRFMVREVCEEVDFSLERSSVSSGTNIARIEFQANFLAAGILMPRHNVSKEFRYIAESLDLADRGFGPLYVDNQRCNLQSFKAVLGHLQRRFEVSRTAAAIRLKSLGMLRDERSEADRVKSFLTSVYPESSDN